MASFTRSGGILACLAAAARLRTLQNTDSIVIMSDLPPRQVHLDGAHNFRDLGGYRLSCGGVFSGARVYRSDHLGGLTDDDRQKLVSLGVTTVVDFRRAYERAENPDRLEGTGIDEVWLPVEAEGVDVINIRRAVEEGELDTAGAQDYLTRANTAFVTHFSRVFSDFLHLLLEPGRLPLVFHCSAGKDRAGFAAALTLLIAGASRQAVMQDYLATNHCNARYRQSLKASLVNRGATDETQRALDALMQVHPTYLGAAFAAIEAGYRDDDHYFSTALDFGGSKRASLKALLTDPVQD